MCTTDSQAWSFNPVWTSDSAHLADGHSCPGVRDRTPPLIPCIYGLPVSRSKPAEESLNCLISKEMSRSPGWCFLSRWNYDPAGKVRCAPRRVSLKSCGDHSAVETRRKKRCLVCRLPLHSTLMPTPSLPLDCCCSSTGGPPRSAARMTQSRSCWRESVWWCATPPHRRSHQVMPWACQWGQELGGWHFRPFVTPTTNRQRWATEPWPSTLTRWVLRLVFGIVWCKLRFWLNFMSSTKNDASPSAAL